MTDSPDPSESGRSAESRATSFGTPAEAPEGSLERAPRPSAAVIESICPYLETADGAWLAGRPDRDHRCGAVEPSAALSPEKQRRLCLGATHAACPTYLAAKATRPERLGRDGHLAGGTAVERTVAILLDRPGPVGSRTLQAAPLGQLALAALMLVALAVVVYARVLAPVPPAPAVASSPVASASAAPSASAASSTGPTATARPSPTSAPTVAPTVRPTVRPTARPTSPPIATNDYTVRSGDTLYAIAVRFQTTVAQLQALNGLNGATIYVGQVLKVPA